MTTSIGNAGAPRGRGLRAFAAKLVGRGVPIGGTGPRGFVGGLWHELGELQFRYLVDNGLRPEHVLLDIACGSLRGGVRLIPYLDTGHYLGIDIEPDLIAHGRKVELGAALEAIKQPQFVVSGDFAFEKFPLRPDYALAQSLFTHLIPADIELCLSKLAAWRKPTTIFFATIFEVDQPFANPTVSDPHGVFRYTRAEMTDLAARTGWKVISISDWNHPRGQKMVRFEAG